MAERIAWLGAALLSLFIVVEGTIDTKSIFVPILGMPGIIAFAYCAWRGKRKV